MLYCLKYVLSGSTIFLSVLNPGVVDNISTHRFTCYVSAKRVSNDSPKLIFKGKYLGLLNTCKKYVWIIEILRNVILICFEQALTENGNTVYMSDSKGSCEAGQTPTTKSSDGSGTLQLASTGWSKNNQYMRCISNKVIEKEKNQNQISSFVKFNISERFYNRISVLSYF